LKKRKPTINRAGGLSFKQDPKEELASILLTSFVQDQYYRSKESVFEEVRNLLTSVDPLFAAKATVFARQEYGMRSITQVMAAELAPLVTGQDWAKNFYAQVIKRPDDMLEILAYYWSLGNSGIPNAMKKGFAKAFDQFDGYQLAKYRAANKGVKLVDIVNLVRPRPTKSNAAALQALVENRLRSTGTWESKLTKAGIEAKDEEGKKASKAKVWEELIRTKKLGYFALLRNLRNIAEQAPDCLGEALSILVDPGRIRKSMVLPFRYITAMDSIATSSLGIRQKRRIQRNLNKALEISVNNVPVFDGRTLVVLDDSGSMTWGKKNAGKTPIEIGALFAALLYKSNAADLMRFSSDASYVYPYYQDSALGIAKGMVERAKAAGTNFNAIFEKANKAYDRIIILSDMQAWEGYYSPKLTFDSYKQEYNANPYIYSFDLQGYGSMQFQGDRAFLLAGFSEKVFDVMKLLESDRQALINKIETVQIAS